MDVHRVLHTAMERAVKWRLLPLNPVDGAESPHVPQKEGEFLTAEESERLVDALIDHEYELPISSGSTALRPAEDLALRWRDIDLETAELRVIQNVHRVRNDHLSEHTGQGISGFRFGPAKTHRSKRPVSMPQVVVDLLRSWKATQAAERLRIREAWADLDLAFTDGRGYPHDPNRVRRRFFKALESAEVRPSPGRRRQGGRKSARRAGEAASAVRPCNTNATCRLLPARGQDGSVESIVC